MVGSCDAQLWSMPQLAQSSFTYFKAVSACAGLAERHARKTTCEGVQTHKRKHIRIIAGKYRGLLCTKWLAVGGTAEASQVLPDECETEKTPVSRECARRRHRCCPDRRGRLRHVRTAASLSLSGHCERFKSGPRASLDHLVGGGQQRFRDGDAEYLGGPQVDGQVEPGWVLHRQVGRLVPLEDAADILTYLTIFRDVR
jgi:hypothetical protein